MAAAIVPVGVGGALTVAPIASLVMNNAPTEVAGTAAGVLSAFRQLGGPLGVVGVGAVIAGHAAFMDGLIASVAILGITAALSLTLPPQQHVTR